MKIESNFQKIIKTFEKQGLAERCSTEVTQRIDKRIADAFEKASKEATKKQLQSWEIMKKFIWK